MISFTPEEERMVRRIRELKAQSGSHSPSKFTLEEKIPGLDIRIDACFLSNPYATDLFLDWLKRDLVETGRLRDVLEFYPSQNQAIAENLAAYFDLPASRVFIGNGAIEIIQAILHRFCRKKIVLNIPTFSSYYEFAPPGVEVVLHRLKKEDDYRLDPDEYIRVVKESGADTAVLINPNNPDGGHIPFTSMQAMIAALSHLDQLIIDESFIHFAYADADESYSLQSVMELVKQHPHLVVVKSMSKDFGIAGIRAGFGVMSAAKVEALLANGYLWNSNGLAEYFFKLYSSTDFLQAYEEVRIRYIRETRDFLAALQQVPGIRTTPSKANFVLMEMIDGSTADDTMAKLLVSEGIYTRTCSDKIGLEGEYLRIASRTAAENEVILRALRNAFSS